MTPPNQRSRYSQPNLPTLLVSYNQDGRPASGSPDRRIRMSQPTLNSSFSGINLVGINRGRLSNPSLRASGDNYINFRIEEERLSAPNVHSAGLTDHDTRRSQPDVTHVLRRDPPHRRDRLSQPTLVPGDYYPGRGHQRLSQPCLSSGRDVTILNYPIKHKRRSSPPKVAQRDRLYQLDFGQTARSRYLRELQPVDMTNFNRDRFSIPELETANDLRLIAGTPKQRFSLDSSLNESKRRSRLLTIASSPISENLVKVDHGIEGKKAADCFESVLITSTTPILTRVDSVFDPLPSLSVLPADKTTEVAQSHRMSVPDISTSSLRRLLDPPAKQRHSITGNLKQCLLPSMGKKGKKEEIEGSKKPENNDAKEPPKNVQKHYSYTYETPSTDSPFNNKETMSVRPRKKFLESNFDRNEQVITTVIESEVPMILTSPKCMKKATVYGSETPTWMRKYLNTDDETPNVIRKNIQSSKRKAWQNSTMNSMDSEDLEKDVKVNSGRKKPDVGGKKVTAISNSSKRHSGDSVRGMKDTCVRIESRNLDNRFKISGDNSGWIETEICMLYGLDSEDTESDESTSI